MCSLDLQCEQNALGTQSHEEPPLEDAVGLLMEAFATRPPEVPIRRGAVKHWRGTKLDLLIDTLLGHGCHSLLGLTPDFLRIWTK